jgi:hypothetical protein
LEQNWPFSQLPRLFAGFDNRRDERDEHLRGKSWTEVREHMKTFLKAALLAGVMFTSVAAFAQVQISVQIGPPPPPRVVYVQPARPAVGFVWVAGYWYPVGRKYRWHEGYWTRPPYAGALWVAPRYDGRVFVAGYWQGPRGRVDHDHHWDRDRERDLRGRERAKAKGKAKGHDRD